MNTNNTTSPEKGLFADKALVAPAILVVVPSLVAGIKIVTKSGSACAVAIAVVLALVGVAAMIFASRKSRAAGDGEKASDRLVLAGALGGLAVLLLLGAGVLALARAGSEGRLRLPEKGFYAPSAQTVAE